MPNLAPEHTCVLADDHDAVRDGVRQRLETAGLVRVVGESRTVREATRLCVELRPDLLVLDMRLRDGDGLEVLDQLRDHAVPTRTVVLSAHPDPLLVERALEAGALGYVAKDADRPVLVDAVRAALDNRRYVDPGLIAALMNPGESLSEREQEVLELIGAGMQNDAIAARLGLSVETVKTHVSSLLRKLGASSRTQAVATAFRRALIR